MATAATYEYVKTGRRGETGARAIVATLGLTALPLGIFGLVNLGAEAAGILPLYFSPFGLPGWMGAVAHLVQLVMLGAALAALWRVDAPASPKAWVAAFTLGYIFLPFITPPLDSLQLSVVCTTLFLVGLAAAGRASKASALSAWFMAPVLGIVGLSATMGLAMAAAFTPPFALMQGTEPVPAAI